MDWAEGIDITIDPVLDENGDILLDDVKFGKGKYFPSGPTCIFRGKEIKYLPLASPSGGITGELLLDILKWVDAHNVYDRSPRNPTPVLIVDGHCS
jgi:hypothetical protein